MASSKKPSKPKKVVIDIPREIWELTEEEKAELQRKFRTALIEVKALASEGDEEDGGLTPKIENT